MGHQITSETKGRAELRDTGSSLMKTVMADMGFKVDLLLPFIVKLPNINAVTYLSLTPYLTFFRSITIRVGPPNSTKASPMKATDAASVAS